MKPGWLLDSTNTEERVGASRTLIQTLAYGGPHGSEAQAALSQRREPQSTGSLGCPMPRLGPKVKSPNLPAFSWQRSSPQSHT
jgi:hypothetical protein